MRSLYERAVQGLSKTTVYAGLTLAAAADWLVVIVLHFVCDCWSLFSVL